MSTYLSKDAQDVKKRFTAILQPKQYKKGIVLLCVFVLLAAGASGCLQIKEPIAGAEQLERFEKYLPQGLEFGDRLEYDEVLGKNNMYSWVDYADETEIKAVASYGATEEICNILFITDKENQVFTYDVSMNFAYRVQENLPKHSLSDEEAKQLAENFLKDISGESGLQLQDWQPAIMQPYRQDGLHENEIGWLADSSEADYHYEIIVERNYGYVQHYRKYFDDEQQRAQMMAWLLAEATEAFAPYPHVVTVGGDVSVTSCWLEGSNYYLDTGLDLVYFGEENDRDADSIWGKTPADTAAAEHLTRFLQVKACAPIQPDGSLDLTKCRMYILEPDENGGAREVEISEFDVFIGKSINAMPYSSRENIRMIKVAENFADTLARVTNQKDKTIKPYVGDYGTIYQMTLPDYAYQMDSDETWQSINIDFHKRYGQLGNDKESYEPVALSAELVKADGTTDTLQMYLETVDGAWKVTEAWIEK